MESIDEFKRLKEWAIKYPIEAAMRIQEQQQEIEQLKVIEQNYLFLLDAISVMSNADEIHRQFERQKSEFSTWSEENKQLGNTR